ncbi:MAG: hypothetical protein U5R14_07205 [Gemmatimonadota bacterium]|nr:hypothetical protein [Gemmatimonadota bacterium]
MLKLIAWLVGLLLALVTMNLSAYLFLTVAYFGAKAVRKVARDKLKATVDDLTGRGSKLPPKDS